MWLSAKQAVELLGVSRATLYAYVSRGFIRSEPVPGKPRERRYAREDVERLRLRAEERKNPEKAAEHALRWGLPVVETSITLITDGRLYYRGHDAVELARTRSLEEVAALIWTGSFETDLLDTPLHVVAGGAAAGDLPFVNRAASILPLVGARDALAFDLRPRSVAQTGWRIVNLLTSVAAESRELEATVEETLARAWARRAKIAAPLLRAALIVSADEEVNVSAFTARCVASAAANPYAVVAAALAALDGTRHGGAIARVSALWDELRRARDLREALAARLRRGESVDGFGHELHSAGDPRAALLLELLPKGKERTFALALAEAAASVVGDRPSLEFALVAVERTLALPRGSALALFAIGRTIGWIAHAIEQYEQNAVMRPRTRYAGELPL